MSAANQDGRFDPVEIPLQVNSGHHVDAEPGVLIAAGPGLAPQHREDPAGDRSALAALERAQLPTLGRVIDLTPTLLGWLGIPLGVDTSYVYSFGK